MKRWIAILKREREEADIAWAHPVAEWMATEFNRHGKLYHNSTAHDIGQIFGEEFVYKNKSGGLAIDTRVLAGFRKLTERSAVWDAYLQIWRQRRPDDDPNSRAVPFPNSD
jgi:hypothetical protein